MTVERPFQPEFDPDLLSPEPVQRPENQTSEARENVPDGQLAAVVVHAEVTVRLDSVQALQQEIVALVSRYANDPTNRITVDVHSLLTREQADAELERRLGMSVEHALSALDLPQGRRTREWSMLLRIGVHSLRDLVVVGRSWVRSNARGIGSTAMHDLERAVAHHLPTASWTENPDMASIVHFYPNLATVSTLVINSPGDSIQEVLDWDEAAINRRHDPDAAREAQLRARDFAAAFMAERARQGLDRHEPPTAGRDHVEC